MGCGCGPPTLETVSQHQRTYKVREDEPILTLIARFASSHTLIVGVGTGRLLGASVGTGFETDSEVGRA